VYEIDWSEEARADMRAVPAFARAALRSEARHLRYQALFVTRNRKPLRVPIAGLPEAQWQSRVGEYRILYCVIDMRTVLILRVILKGADTTAEALSRSWRR
jgi:mRNA-degrading endonuclease RelE of RelBE toxin-antitoxin system